MGLEGRLAARRNAPFQVQLELAKFPARPRMPGYLQIQGKVVHVFRGGALLQPGAPVEFSLWVCEKGDEPTGPAFVYYKDLVACSYMEAYLFGTPPNCHLAAYEYVLLKGPSLDARMSIQELEDFMETSEVPPGLRRAKKWWQFWHR